MATQNAHPRGALAHLRRISGVALLRVALWAAGAFTVSALLVTMIAWLASGAGVHISTPALLVALALGLAVGWAAGLVALTLETLRLLEAGVEAGVAKRQR